MSPDPGLGLDAAGDLAVLSVAHTSRMVRGAGLSDTRPVPPGRSRRADDPTHDVEAAAVKIPTRLANCEGVSEADPRDEALLALTRPGKWGKPKVILLSEVSHLDVGRLAKQLGMFSLQHGRRGSAEAGVAVVAWRPIRAMPMIVGSKDTAEGGGIRMRPLTGGFVKGVPVPFTSGHAPPERADQAQDQFIDEARSCRGVVGCDWNHDVEWMRRTSDRRYVGHGVLGLLIPEGCSSTDAEPIDVDSDHLAVDIELYVPRRR